MIFANTLAANFTEVKTLVYWAIAVALILATRGRLGVPRSDGAPAKVDGREMEVIGI